MTRAVIGMTSIPHAWRVPRPNGPCVGAMHVMRGMWGVWHVTLDLLFLLAAGRSPFTAWGGGGHLKMIPGMR